MSRYIENNLINDEKIIYSGHISLWAMFPICFMGVLLLPLAGVGLILLLAAFVHYKSTELAFTNKRVMAKSGFISRKTIEMNIHKVESLQVKQGILGRIFNYGSIVISGAGNPQAPIEGIADPLGFRRAFMEYQDRKNSAS